MATRKMLFLLVCMLLVSSLSAWADYQAKQTPQWSDATLGKCVSPGCWVDANGAGYAVSSSTEGDVWACGTDGNVYHKLPDNSAFTFVGTFCYDIAAASTQQKSVYIIEADHKIYKWAGGTTFTLFSSKIVNTIRVGVDGDLWAAEGSTAGLGNATHWNGSGWTTYSFNVNSMAVGAKDWVFVRQGSSVYKFGSGVFTIVTGAPAAINIATAGRKGLLIVGTDNRLHYTSGYTGPWSTMAAVPGGLATLEVGAGSLSGIYVIAGNASKFYHLNNFLYGIFGSLSGDFAQECQNMFPSTGQCPAGSSHTITYKISAPNGSGGTQQSVTGTPTQILTASSSFFTSPACEFQFRPGDPDCIPSEIKTANCAVMGPLGTTPSTDPVSPCLSHMIPVNGQERIQDFPRPFGWVHGVTVPVYISTNFTTVQRSAIFTGIKNWSVYNSVNYGNSYILSSTKPTGSGLWLWVQDFNGGCGSVSFNTAELVVGTSLQHSTITMNKLDPHTCAAMTNAQYAGDAAHEEGHNNYLGNCLLCVQGTTVMGPNTYATNQPQSPTACDRMWAFLYDLVN